MKEINSYQLVKVPEELKAVVKSRWENKSWNQEIHKSRDPEIWFPCKLVAVIVEPLPGHVPVCPVSKPCPFCLVLCN